MTARRKASLLALAVWPLFLVTAVTLGAVREKLITPSLGEQVAHVVGTLLFIATMLAILESGSERPVDRVADTSVADTN